MTARRYFGTDGVRGPYGGSVLNEAFVARLGAAAAAWLKARGRPAGPVLIGRDTRASGAALAHALASGLTAGGAQPSQLGIVPTPAVSWAVRTEGAALGAVITASHNPAADNGVKFFGPDGAKLTDEDEVAIEALLPAGPVPVDAASPPTHNALTGYLAAASAILPAGALRGRRLALDTANGATCVSSPAVFRGYGAELVSVGHLPNGQNINAEVGSEHPERLAGLVVARGAWLGVAHDGDGDRCVLCDETGSILDGDELLTILATDALARGTLAERTLVVTVQSNLGVDAAVTAAGGTVLRSAVGDRYVAERMRASGAILGGESSGHIVCFDLGPTGDGLAAALKIAGVMLSTGQPLSQLRRRLRRFPQASTAVVVREKKPIESLPNLSGAIAALERALGERGRVLVRYSGTEPKLRLLVEGPDEPTVAQGMASLMAAARVDLGFA